jgi:L-lysine 2,3-aminomutase
MFLQEARMFPTFDPKFFEQFSLNPASFLSKLADFQRANLEAAREIAETNTKAFQQLAAARDPQAFMTIQQAVIQAAIQRNTEIMTRLWESLGNEPVAPKKK